MPCCNWSRYVKQLGWAGGFVNNCEATEVTRDALKGSLWCARRGSPAELLFWYFKCTNYCFQAQEWTLNTEKSMNVCLGRIVFSSFVPWASVTCTVRRSSDTVDKLANINASITDPLKWCCCMGSSYFSLPQSYQTLFSLHCSGALTCIFTEPDKITRYRYHRQKWSHELLGPQTDRWRKQTNSQSSNSWGSCWWFQTKFT